MLGHQGLTQLCHRLAMGSYVSYITCLGLRVLSCQMSVPDKVSSEAKSSPSWECTRGRAVNWRRNNIGP